MTESIAIVLYRTLAGQQGSETDDLTSHVAETILKDELEHLGIGVSRLRQLRAEDPDAVDAALKWAHPRVMPQLFSLMDTSCESLCDELSLDCESLDPDAISADLEVIRARAATQYMDALDAVGFPLRVTASLVGQMAAMDADEAQIQVAAVRPSCC